MSSITKTSHLGLFFGPRTPPPSGGLRASPAWSVSANLSCILKSQLPRGASSNSAVLASQFAIPAWSVLAIRPSCILVSPLPRGASSKSAVLASHFAIPAWSVLAGGRRASLGLPGPPWVCLGFLGLPRPPRAFLGLSGPSWASLGSPWASLGLPGPSWTWLRYYSFRHVRDMALRCQ